MTPMVPPGSPGTSTPDPRIVTFYEEEAQRYFDSLELVTQTVDQAHQRLITLASFDVIAVSRPDIQCFNDLLIQYPRGRGESPGKVVPDNFVVVHPTPLEPTTNFALEIQPVEPLLVLEYVSTHDTGKDYDNHLRRYETELKVPYCLVWSRENQELSLLGRGKANDAGRFEILELEVKAAILDGWVRFWFRGELVPLPGDLVRERNAERTARLAEQKARLAEQKARTSAEQRATDAEAELARLREELARLKGAS